MKDSPPTEKLKQFSFKGYSPEPNQFIFLFCAFTEQQEAQITLVEKKNCKQFAIKIIILLEIIYLRSKLAFQVFLPGKLNCKQIKNVDFNLFE